MRAYRSLLFVPGHKPDWVAKAVKSGADAIVLDLEDSVPAASKAAARAAVAASIGRATVDVFVRPNALATRLAGADLEAVVVPGLTGLFLPKVGDAKDLVRFDALVDHFETRNGVSNLEYVVPIETVPAIQNCREIASGSPRVGALVGPTARHADIAREVGFEWTPDGLETLYLRSRVLLACREAGRHPLTGLWEDLADTGGLASFARAGRRLGYRGMIAIHPSHVPVVNAVFTPSTEEVDFYRGLVEAYEEGVRRGEGAVRYRGVHVDKAHYDKAVQWLGEWGIREYLEPKHIQWRL